MAVFGRINGVWSSWAKRTFETRCVALLRDACVALKAKDVVNVDWGEENITANIYVYIVNSPQAINHDIFIENEHSFYGADVLNNRKKARTAPRIDLVLQNNWRGQKLMFYVEAKNLVENDFRRTGRRTVCQAKAVQQRYIDTGIDHYLEGYYPMGCVLAYILNGTAIGVVDGINSLLSATERNTEILSLDSGISPWLCFKSTHVMQQKEIAHYMMEF